jgi:hypothetical protein
MDNFFSAIAGAGAILGGILVLGLVLDYLGDLFKWIKKNLLLAIFIMFVGITFLFYILS